MDGLKREKSVCEEDDVSVCKYGANSVKLAGE